MPRSYYSQNLSNFFTDESSFILGELTKHHEFDLEEQQRNAWIKQIEILKKEFKELENARIMFEYTIPRMGKRVDIILIYSGLVFVIEFKVYATKYTSGDATQCLDYALDLKNFHEESHDAILVPILVSTEADEFGNNFEQYEDKIVKLLKCNKNNLKNTIQDVCEKFQGKSIDPIQWENSRYKPTPTIIEAAQAVYRGHNVQEISRSDAGAFNLTKTTDAINNIIEKSKKEKKKSIIFVTGVPGSGKTLAGLNFANERHKFSEDEHAIFLAGNAPLVEVLQEALARDEIKRSSKKIKKDSALRKAKAFIQMVHHFIDDALKNEHAPIEKVVIFDEAQRVWDKDQLSKFMKSKKGIPDFDQSQPDFLLSYMDRHKDWCVFICLVGGGQEINAGEVGISGWFDTLKKQFKHWNVYVSPEIGDSEYVNDSNLDEMLTELNYHMTDNLHLRSSIRSFRSEDVSKFVKALLDIDKETAKETYKELEKFPIFITRDMSKAKEWLKKRARGNERIGLITSSNAHRLREEGIYLYAKFSITNWFLNPKEDIRSSNFLELAATEFDIQGLELDWVCVAWDADLRFNDDSWNYHWFRGTKWNDVHKPIAKTYLKNTFRVLLTRARQGMIIYIPKGNDTDPTRNPEFYNGTFNYLKEIGIKEI